MKRYGAAVLGSASYFSRLKPRALQEAIITAQEQKRDELLYIQWLASGQTVNFSEYRNAVLHPPKKKTADEILDDVKGIMDGTTWRER